MLLRTDVSKRNKNREQGFLQTNLYHKKQYQVQKNSLPGESNS